MKYLKFLIIVLLIAACKYEDPLTEEHKIPIDPAVLGEWVPVPDQKPLPDEKMVVMKYSDTEYLIAINPEIKGEGGMYFRGYPIRVGGVACVQLKLIGIWNRAIESLKKGRTIDSSEESLFDVAVYQFENDELTVKTINPDLVDKRLKGKDFEAAFLRNSNNKNLFMSKDSLRFKKVQRKSEWSGRTN